MQKRAMICLVLTLALWLQPWALQPASAGATLTIDDETSIDLGFRLQGLYLRTDSDLDGDGDFESVDDFRVRRARLRLKADVTERMGMFIQTEFSEEGASGGDARIIDAFVQLKAHPLATFYLGENMAPALRQNLTSSGALMAIDRPGISYKNLTWGTRARAGFTNVAYDDSDAGLRGDVDVRDLGLTLFGSTSLSDMMHLKYYLGIYDGIQQAEQDSERLTGRVQINLLEPEAGYYNASTYLGKKKTLAIGAAYDAQSDVAVDLDTGESADYALYTVDLFAEHPLGPGSLTFETAYLDLDLDDAARLDHDGDGADADADATPSINARKSQGDGFYAQAGYFIRDWQPWAAYEQWESDAAGDLGSFDAFRIGLSYFLKGHNANIKVGYEIFSPDTTITKTNEDEIETFVTGLYVTY